VVGPLATSKTALARTRLAFAAVIWFSIAARTIASDRDRTIRILAGADDALRVWVNGELALSDPGLHGAVPDQCAGTARLRAGENSLVVEVSNGPGAWRLYLRLEDEDGRRLRLADDGSLEPLDSPR
jgi:hypothetical protein